MDLSQLRIIVQEECQLAPEMPVLVGLSGGPDSLCLLDLLRLLGFAVIAAHVDHSLRPSSQADASFVRDFCAQQQVQLVETRLDVGTYARQVHLSIEEAARILRYRFLFDQAEQLQAQAVAVAHTADDQVETVLMHLLRGSGLGGLKGMPYRSSGREWGSQLPLIRPLLSTWRSQVIAHCQERNMHPLMDETNFDPRFFRNRLRLELIPNLQSYNPQVKQVLWRMAQTLGGDHQVLEETLNAARLACNQQNRQDYVRFDLAPLASLPTGQKRSLLRGAIAHLLPDLRDIDFNVIERALVFMKKPPLHQQADWVKGLYLFIEADHLFVARWGAHILDDDWPWIEPGSTQSLAIPGIAQLGGNWRLQATLHPQVDPAEILHTPVEPYQCWLDAGTLHLPLSIRASRPGERIQPLGMDGHSLRLSDYWVNKKLPRRARATWPLVWSGTQVAWAPGYQPGHPFRITSQTRDAVKLELLPHAFDERNR